MRTLTVNEGRPEQIKLDDQAALGRYARVGDPAAFEVLAARYQAMVLATCRRTLGNEADAEDAAQETFLKLAQSAGDIRSNAASWLYSCAVGTSVDLIRRTATRRRVERAAVAARPGRRDQLAATPDTTTDTQILWQDIEPLLDIALAELRDEDREVIVGRFLAGRTPADLAREAGVSDGTMHRRIQRAVGRLRARLVASGLALAAPATLARLGQAPLVAASPHLATAVAKIGLAGMAASTAAAGVFTKVGLMFAALLGGGGLLVAGFIPGLFLPADPVPAAVLLASDGVAVARPVRASRPMQMISGAYPTFAEGGVWIRDNQIRINLRADAATGDVATLLFSIQDVDDTGDQIVLDTVVEDVDMLADMTAPFKKDQSVPIGVSFDEFGRLVLEPLLAGTKLGRNEPKWFGVRPPTGWAEQEQIPEDAGPLGIDGPWAASERWPVRLTSDQIIFGGRNWNAMRFRVMDWVEAEGYSEVTAVYRDGWDRGLVGTEFQMLIREVPGGYTLAYYPASVVEPGTGWPTSFRHSEENPVQVFGFTPDPR